MFVVFVAIVHDAGAREMMWNMFLRARFASSLDVISCLYKT